MFLYSRMVIAFRSVFWLPQGPDVHQNHSAFVPLAACVMKKPPCAPEWPLTIMYTCDPSGPQRGSMACHGTHGRPLDTHVSSIHGIASTVYSVSRQNDIKKSFAACHLVHFPNGIYCGAVDATALTLTPTAHDSASYQCLENTHYRSSTQHIVSHIGRPPGNMCGNKKYGSSKCGNKKYGSSMCGNK